MILGPGCDVKGVGSGCEGRVLVGDDVTCDDGAEKYWLAAVLGCGISGTGARLFVLYAVPPRV